MLFAILLSIILNFSVNTDVNAVPHQDELYHVIVTQGVIVNKTSNEVLKRGMKIKAGDQVVFKSGNARAIVIGNRRGRFVLSPKEKQTSSELIATVFEAVSPLKTNSKLSTRGFEDAEEVVNFRDYFGDTTFAIVGNKLPVKVASNYQMDDHNFFIVRYVYQGEVVNKLVGFKGSVLTLDKNELSSYKGKNYPINEVEQVSLYYVTGYDRSKGEKGNPQLITEFKPLFLTEKEVESTLKELKSIFTGDNLNYEQMLDEYFTFVRDVYGVTDKNVLEDWLLARDLLKKS